MQVLVHTARNIHTDPRRVGYMEVELTSALEGFSRELARVDAYLSDESAARSGGAVHCLLEAHPAHQDPVTVTHQAASVAAALGGAAHKLLARLSHRFDRLAPMEQLDTIHGR